MTPEQLAEAKFRGPVRFYDGRGGMAQQDFECVIEPRFGYSWKRDSFEDKGRQFYTVDGKPVPNLTEAARLLALPPDPESPAEATKRGIAEFRASPRVSGATRALSEARMNADAGPFGTVRAWLRRASDAWHVGINRHVGVLGGYRERRWLYDAKSAAHESYRLQYLFAADRKTDTGLICALGTRCRDCPILRDIETSMTAERERERFPADIDEADIDAAKVWTCLTHILIEKAEPIDGVFVASERDRENAADEVARWASMASDPP